MNATPALRQADVPTLAHWIGGKRTPGNSGRYGDVFTPATGALGCRVLTEGVALRRIVFVRYDRERSAPSLRPLSPGEASLRLYQGALNQLAHPCWGLDDTIELVRRAECLELLAAGIEETVAVLRSPP